MIMLINQWELACIEYALKDFKANVKDSERTDLITGTESVYEKIIAFVKECELNCDVGNFQYTAELKFVKKGNSEFSSESSRVHAEMGSKTSERKKKTSAENGKKGGRPRKNSSSSSAGRTRTGCNKTITTQHNENK